MKVKVMMSGGEFINFLFVMFAPSVRHFDKKPRPGVYFVGLWSYTWLSHTKIQSYIMLTYLSHIIIPLNNPQQQDKDATMHFAIVKVKKWLKLEVELRMTPGGWRSLLSLRFGAKIQTFYVSSFVTRWFLSVLDHTNML